MELNFSVRTSNNCPLIKRRTCIHICRCKDILYDIQDIVFCKADDMILGGEVNFALIARLKGQQQLPATKDEKSSRLKSLLIVCNLRCVL